MLIICEGLDKSGKSTLVQILHMQIKNSIVIKKTYNENLYPIDFGAASCYDWQAMLDRIVLANPDVVFIADRSFFTQTVYQICLGVGEHTITNEQMQMFNNYCKVVQEMPHLVIYCQSSNFELDRMVRTKQIRAKLDDMYKRTLQQSGLNVLMLNMTETTLQNNINKIKTVLQKNDNNQTIQFY
jgi:thymidylate kinase